MKDDNKNNEINSKKLKAMFTRCPICESRTNHAKLNFKNPSKNRHAENVTD